MLLAFSDMVWQGFSTLSTTLTAGDFSIALDASDFDGDGDNDLVVVNHLTNNASVLLNNGTGTAFTPALGSPNPTGNGPTDVVAINVEGDCDVDFAVSNEDDDSVTVHDFGIGSDRLG